jgi:hypothetical protein
MSEIGADTLPIGVKIRKSGEKEGNLRTLSYHTKRKQVSFSMTTITELGRVMQELLTTTADEIGRSSGFIRRQRKLTGSSYAQTLVFGWMSNPAATMSELSQAAATVGTAISKQGLDERSSARSARFMGELLQCAVGQLVEGEAVRVGVFANFSQVHVLDSTSISLPEALHEQWPGCNAQGVGSAALKVSVDWELVQGRLAGVHLQAGKAHDQHSGGVCV